MALKGFHPGIDLVISQWSPEIKHWCEVTGQGAWGCSWICFRRKKADTPGAEGHTGASTCPGLQTGPGLRKVVSCLCIRTPNMVENQKKTGDEINHSEFRWPLLKKNSGEFFPKILFRPHRTARASFTSICTDDLPESTDQSSSRLLLSHGAAC